MLYKKYKQDDWNEGVSGVLCDRMTLLKRKRKFYKMSIKLVMLYEVEYWVVKWVHEQKMSYKDENIKVEVWTYDDR